MCFRKLPRVSRRKPQTEEFGKNKGELKLKAISLSARYKEIQYLLMRKYSPTTFASPRK